MIRYAIALSVLALPSTARADAYVAFDASGAYRTGPYRWQSPPGFTRNGDTSPVDLRTSVGGLGVITHVAVGAAFPERWAIAGELGLGLLSLDSGFQYSGPSGVSGAARLGVRAEKLLGAYAFVRATVGYEVLAFSGGGPTISARENVWEAEATHGPFAGVATGARFRRFGDGGARAAPLVRIDVGRATSEHAVYWPITFSLGLDVAWN